MKKTKCAIFSGKGAFLTPLYAHMREATNYINEATNYILLATPLAFQSPIFNILPSI